MTTVGSEALQYSSASLHRRTINNTAIVMAKIDKLSKQVASGIKAENYSDLEVNEFSVLGAMESEYTGTKNYFSVSSNMENRLAAMEASLISLREIASDVLQDAKVAANPLMGKDLDIVTISENFLKSVSSFLNNSFEGRYLFGGSKTNTTPVPDIVQSSLDGSGNATNSYYKGNKDILSFKIDSDFELEYGITADEKAFQKLIAGLHLLISARQNDNLEDVNKAIDYFLAADDDIGNIVTVLGSKIRYLKRNNENISLKITELDHAINNIVATDIAAAMTEMNLKHTSLQAVFMLYSRIAQISMVDFL